METTRISIPLDTRAYDIFLGRDLFAADWSISFLTGRRCLIVADSNTGPLYGERLRQRLLSEGAAQVEMTTFPAGEASKTLTSMARLYEAAVTAGLDRKSVVVGLGGGVTGDMAGFLAATYMRGIQLLQVPTSLLAQVDSSVGGKTGVDLPQGKNLVGAFWQPARVMADLDTLSTLPLRELRCGLAEVVKYGVILDADFFHFLEENADTLDDPAAAAYLPIVRRSCELKAEVVLKDEREAGLRAILNFGHTFGHAIERISGYARWSHGEAVAVGMCMAADLASLLDGGAACRETAARLEALLQRLGLPVRVPGLEPQTVREAMQTDKKNENGRLRLVLPRRIGEVALDADPDAAAILSAIGGRCAAE